MAFDLEQVIEAAVARGVQRALERLPAREAPAELLTASQAAKVAHVCEDTIRKWVAEGLLKRYGSDSVLRVRSDELLSVKPKPRDRPRRPEEVVASLLGRKAR